MRAVLCVADTSCRAALSQFLLHLQVYEEILPLNVSGQFCSDMSPGTSALHSVQELGTAAVAFLLHHPGPVWNIWCLKLGEEAEFQCK